MSKDKLLVQLERLTLPPRESEQLNRWISQEDTIEFLKNSASNDEIIIYACGPHVYINSIFVPRQVCENPDIDDLLNWNDHPESSWGLCISKDEAYIEEPLSSCGSKSMSEGEKIIFIRSLYGVRQYENYFQINQRLENVLEIHFIKERNSWCVLDENGDYDDIVKIYNANFVLMKRSFIEKYSVLNKYFLLRMFDFTRFKVENIEAWGPNGSVKSVDNIFWREYVQKNQSYRRGFQIIPFNMTSKDVIATYFKPDEEKEYATFVIYDLKNKCIREASCNPKNTTTYFSPQSDLPYEVSPAFFRSEVMNKYKSDPDKYKISERSIECRGAWVLNGVAHNEESQVFTYLKYLRDIPYKEQQYWLSFNEKPKKNIPENIWNTDFGGCWAAAYNPLRSLKLKLQSLRGNVPWWVLRDETLLDKLNYPSSNSSKEWSDEISTLSKVIIEGLDEKWLRKKATELKCNPDEQFRSIKLLKICISALGTEQRKINSIISGLASLNELRNKVAAHAAGDDAEKLKREILEQHETYRKHFIFLVTECDTAFEALVKIFSD